MQCPSRARITQRIEMNFERRGAVDAWREASNQTVQIALGETPTIVIGSNPYKIKVGSPGPDCACCRSQARGIDHRIDKNPHGKEFVYGIWSVHAGCPSSSEVV
jgi:hypothetical protein